MSKSVALHGFGGRNKEIVVKAYATEELLLADKPMENAIGVITETPISSYCLCPYAPIMLTEGLLWIKTGLSSNVAFSAQEKNPVMLYPITAMQVINGTLTYVPARSYQRGEWVDWWEGKLYDHGNEMESVTGGWEVITQSGMTASKEADFIQFAANSTTSPYGLAYTKEKVNIDTIKEIILSLDTTKRVWPSSAYVSFGIAKDNPSESSLSFVASSQNKTIAYDQQLTLDVSGLSGEYYIVVRFVATSGSFHLVRFEQEV